jgi:ABC-type nitrate/sulfonate/bicarbonate transport system permease component
MRPRRFPEAPAFLRSATVLLTIGLLWEVGSHAGLISRTLAPPPSAILAELRAIALSGLLWTHLLATMARLGVGLMAGATIGVGLGLALGWSTPLRHAFDPVVAAIHPIPKIALFPLLIAALGIGESSKVTSVAIGAFFPALLNTIAGVRSINQVQIDLARNYGASKRAMFRRILLPGSLPMVMTGLRLSANVAFLSTIGIEMVAADTGLGSMLWLSWQVYRIERMYATLFVISIIGILIASLIRRASLRAVPWMPEELTR